MEGSRLSRSLVTIMINSSGVTSKMAEASSAAYRKFHGTFVGTSSLANLPQFLGALNPQKSQAVPYSSGCPKSPIMATGSPLRPCTRTSIFSPPFVGSAGSCPEYPGKMARPLLSPDSGRRRLNIWYSAHHPPLAEVRDKPLSKPQSFYQIMISVEGRRAAMPTLRTLTNAHRM